MKQALTIFGGTGDLTFRKLLPALYNMSASGKLPAERMIIIGRRDYNTQTYCEAAREWVRRFSRIVFREEAFRQFIQGIRYYQMDFTQEAAYDALDAFYQESRIDSHIFYFAVAPRFFPVIAYGLGRVTGAEKGKVILEKPFGESLKAAEELNDKLEAFFEPDHIYRIDHYLGKEMIRNIQTIRFTNPIFKNIWNAEYIDNIQISAMENVGVETRAGYYDTSGAMKDMVQNHLLQILSIVAMERPQDLSPEGMHEEQIRVLKALRPVRTDQIGRQLVLAQYEGYLQEPGVPPDSITETYAALKVFIDNERWKGTPFYIRTGKKLGRREMEVTIVFKRPESGMEPDILVVKIQPEEGVHLQFNIKKPGDTDEISQAKMDFCQSCSLENRINTPEAYERLLGACLRGERSWFSQWDQIETSWNYIDQLRSAYRQTGQPIYTYPSGTNGPEAADELLGAEGHQWIVEEL
ncbi:glucose-6-phosphate dehydrogenase [Diplocloster hominis]|uniref:glucose-6-phosphate dehydrogenase n=1 Tax=Diplocloster hominis TaxID=3079010 RepID=UPI0031B9DB75